MAVRTSGRRITRDDLQAAFAEVLGEGEQTARDSAPRALLIGGGVALLVVATAYLIGRRRGRRHTAILEVRRL
jgi:hypothetical protein